LGGLRRIAGGDDRDRLDNDIRPARLLGWETIRVAQGFARFQLPRDLWEEPDRTVANLRLLLPIFARDRSLFWVYPLSTPLICFRDQLAHRSFVTDESRWAFVQALYGSW
jgi:hypothetical protein